MDASDLAMLECTRNPQAHSRRDVLFLLTDLVQRSPPHLNVVDIFTNLRYNCAVRGRLISIPPQFSLVSQADLCAVNRQELWDHRDTLNELQLRDLVCQPQRIVVDILHADERKTQSNRKPPWSRISAQLDSLLGAF